MQRIRRELGVEAELRFEVKGIQKEHDHVVELDPEGFTAVWRVVVVGLSHATEEVYELGVAQLEHPLFVLHNVHFYRLRLSEDHSEHLVLHVELAMTGKRHTLLQRHLVLLVVRKVVVSLPQRSAVLLKQLN